ncbi:btb/poz and taz domain-containing protein 1 [Quercus suber]|uniref:Btb/poz and taz domain-containing protein 1 n=1 Tax=Quercus suber TaxID=58331 RepID=A0AAW0KV88_QUESU
MEENQTTSLNISDDFYGYSAATARELPEPDVHIITSAALRIPAHSSILASASPVLENIIDRPRKHRSSERVIPILGVPYDAVVSFVRFLYSFRCSEEEMEKYGIHLLALSHVYSVPQLKQSCTKVLGDWLTMENVVDVLQLARMCDAPNLYLKCMKLVANHFKAVEKTEGWKKRSRKLREEQSLYLQLSEAMECLEHICTEGCTSVGPYDMEPTEKKGPCSKFSTCQGLQLLIKHFATCKKRVNGGCLRQFKLRMQQDNKKDDARWRLLVRKVVSAKAISSLSLPKRKREELQETNNNNNHGIRSFRL